MKNKYPFYLMLSFGIVLYSCTGNKQQEQQLKDTVLSNQDIPSIIEHSYFGQKPPGLIPEPFAPGIVTTDNWESGGVFTPDLKEFYFGERQLKKNYSL